MFNTMYGEGFCLSMDTEDVEDTVYDIVARLCFGALLERDAKMPWEDAVYDDVYDWWFLIHNVGVSSRTSEYYELRYAFLKTQPLPIEPIMWGEDEKPQWIISLSHLIFQSEYCDDTPLLIDFWPTVTHKHKCVIMDFCERFNLPVIKSRLGWHLSGCLIQW